MIPEIDNASIAKKVRNMVDEETTLNPRESEDRELTLDLETEEAMVTVKQAAKSV